MPEDRRRERWPAAAAWIGLAMILANVAVVIYLLGQRPYGYHVDIYALVPWWGWTIFGVSFLFAAATLIFARSDANNAQSTPAILVAYSSYLIIGALPILLGYSAWGRGDPLTHVRTVQGIIDTGAVRSTVIYPVSHMIVAVLHLVTGVPVERLMLFLPWALAAVQPWFIVAIARLFGAPRQLALLAGLLAMGFVTGWFINFTPNHIGNLVLPFVLLTAATFALARGSRSLRIAFLLFLVVVLLPPIHIVVGLGAALFVAGLSFVASREHVAAGEPRRLWNHAGFLALWSLVWIAPFVVVEHTVQSFSEQLEGGGRSHVEGVASAAERGAALGFDPVIHLLKAQAPAFLMALVGIISLYCIWRTRGRTFYDRFAIAMLVTAAIGQVIIVVFLLLRLPFSPLRLLIYLMIAGVFLSVVAFRTLLAGHGVTGFAKKALVLALVLAIIASSVMVLYRSPYLRIANDHLLEEEVDAMAWVGDHGQSGRQVFVISAGQQVMRSQLVPQPVPYHFDWAASDVLDSRFCREMVLNPLDRLIYVEILPELADIRWQPEDFDALDGSGNNRVYDNGAVQLWRVCPAHIAS